MKNQILLILIFLITTFSFSQQTQYNVTPGNGNGLRFWNSDSYKIHMGSASEYKFGPVTDYSIKMNMSSNTGRGWTWGVSGVTPVAALSNTGEFQIAKNLTANGFITALNPNNKFASVSLSWLNDIARIRVGGINDGATNGFQIQGPGDQNLFRIMGNGNIGIGTSNPGNWKLSVAGNVNIGGNGNSRLRTRHIDGKSSTSDAVDHLYLNYDIGKNVLIGYGGSKPKSNLLVYGYIRNGAADFQLGTHDGRDQGTKTGNRALVHNTSDRLHLNYAGDFEGGTYIDGPKTIFTSGIVGIGTTNPSINYKLSVNGKVRAKEIVVEAGWADYVFEDTYNLPTLEEVEKHIQEKGHLINIPSAKEVEQNGIAIGKINSKLLEKIEELTLYTIAQEKKIKLQEERLQKLEEFITTHKFNN
ncbi:hypothetical protein M0D21_22490 [Aquimarina sp. D1M17]|uniref:hypothetical protein n=1 Tax=Aquimarina acroporae TaxID=2937283 RepID=UPI0020BF170F|nr:hypothetical protein [Aquimarina acroporae]MCK8524364.1 hypothetical protein [Aquimarina acroporae]